MLRTTDLTFAYNSTTHLTFPDLHCGAGEHWLLLGQSGSGKTTLLHLLAGLRRPTSGQIHIKDTDISRLSGAELDRFRGQHIGLVFQRSHFLRALSVRDNLATAQQLAGLPVDYQRIRTLLEQLNVSHKLHQRPDQLSVGEQQRVDIARAIINQPAIILADEPTSALDDVNAEQVIQLLQQQAAAVDATLLIVTHDNRLKGVLDKQVVLEGVG